jgi:TrmH family RNA methyltransferase
VADAGGTDVGDVAVEDGEGLWLVLSNEGAGVSPDVKKVLEKGGKWQRVGVPMPGDMESLNVAVAGGILMYTLR